jgi:hypothetical protein
MKSALAVANFGHEFRPLRDLGRIAVVASALSQEPGIRATRKYPNIKNLSD